MIAKNKSKYPNPKEDQRKKNPISAYAANTARMANQT
jgi:hypothetical protein